MRNISRKLKQTKKEVSKISKSTPGYSALYDVRTGEKYEIKKDNFQSIRSKRKNSSSLTVKSLKQKVENVKEMHKSFRKEIKQKIKFTIDQVTSVSFFLNT